MNGRGQEYLDLLDIIQAQEKLEWLAVRLALVAERLAKRIDAEVTNKTTVLSPTDRPYETFEASDTPIWEK